MINLEDNWIGVLSRNTVISIRLTFYGQWREFPHYRSQLSITANEFVSALLFIGPSRRETELISNVEIFYAFGTVMKGLCHFAGKITISTCVSISSTWCRPPQNKKDSHKIVSWASKQLEEDLDICRVNCQFFPHSFMGGLFLLRSWRSWRRCY